MLLAVLWKQKRMLDTKEEDEKKNGKKLNCNYPTFTYYGEIDSQQNCIFESWRDYSTGDLPSVVLSPFKKKLPF